MREKKIKILKILFSVFIILLNLIVFWKVNYNRLFQNEKVKLVIRLSSDVNDDYQIYYAQNGEDLTEENSQKINYSGAEKESIQTLEFECPLESEILRLDFGEKSGQINLYDMYFLMSDNTEDLSNDERYDIPLDTLISGDNSIDIASATVINNEDNSLYQNKSLLIEKENGDPNVFVGYDKSKITLGLENANKNKTLIMDGIICLIVDLLAIYILMHFNAFVDIPIEIYQNKKIALTLAKNDFKTKYAGSYLGIIWAFIQPVVTILVYWFVFSIGLKAGKVGEYPFVLFIVTGIIPWFFFSDALNGGTSAMTDYNYLVKKVVSNIDILPFVKVISALFVHCFFIAFALILCTCLGYHPTLFTIQLIYYVICNIIFVLGLSYLTSAIVVFFRDLGQFINIFVFQVGIWLTPIMWNAKAMLPKNIHTIFKLNPIYYIVSGFRDSVLDNRWFWEGDTLIWTIYFWVVTVLTFGLGVKIFRRLKIHFADVL